VVSRAVAPAAVSAAVATSVAAKAVVINAPATLTTISQAKGQFGFEVNGTSGGTYVVEASSDLIHWTAVGRTRRRLSIRKAQPRVRDFSGRIRRRSSVGAGLGGVLSICVRRFLPGFNNG